MMRWPAINFQKGPILTIALLHQCLHLQNSLPTRECVGVCVPLAFVALQVRECTLCALILCDRIKFAAGSIVPFHAMYSAHTQAAHVLCIDAGAANEANACHISQLGLLAFKGHTLVAVIEQVEEGRIAERANCSAHA